MATCRRSNECWRATRSAGRTRSASAGCREINSLGFSIAGALFVGTDPGRDDPEIEEAFGKVAAGILSVPINLLHTLRTGAEGT